MTKTIAWHKLDGANLLRSNERWFPGATHRVIAETRNCYVYDNGFVRGNGADGEWITDDITPEGLGECYKEVIEACPFLAE